MEASRASLFDAEMSDEFQIFWSRYPRRVGRAKAEQVWRKIHPPLAKVLEALAWQSLQPQWQKEHGQFIPHPTTYLNQGRWDDEPPTRSETKQMIIDWRTDCRTRHDSRCPSQYQHELKG